MYDTIMKQNDVVLYLQELTCIDEHTLQLFMEHLPDERYQKARRYRRREDQILSAVSFCLLELALESAGYRATDLLDVKYNAYGKPFCCGKNKPYFNISHCSCAVACVVSSQEVGIDVQDYSMEYESILKYVCSKQEIYCIKHSPNKEMYFTSLWTMKEAYLKMKGIGIGVDLTELDFSEEVGKLLFEKYNLFFHNYSLCGGTMTVCGTYKPPKHREIKINELISFVQNHTRN